jgi:hypothetical protein
MPDKNGLPTLWDCAKDIHSWKDFVDFLPLLVPMPVVRTWHAIRHPKAWLFERQRIKWAKSIRKGDVVCDCSGKHVTVASVIPQTPELPWGFDIMDTDGCGHDLLSCCDPVMADDSCHNYCLTNPDESDTVTP